MKVSLIRRLYRKIRDKLILNTVRTVVHENIETSMCRTQDVLHNSIMHHAELQKFYTFLNSNLIKEQEARTKIASGKKLKVFFIVASVAKFAFKSIYDEMEKSDLFEPTIFIVGYDKQDWTHMEILEAFQYFSDNEYRTVLGYEKDTFRAIPLANFNPDIVFMNDPRLWEFSSFQNEHILFNFLVCYVPYGMSVIENFHYQYEHIYVNFAWKNFVSNYYNYIQNTSKSYFRGLNTFFFGYPKLDDYSLPAMLPSKLKNDKPVVIYAPHYAIGAYPGLATFDVYHNFFMSLVKKYREINFVFKPHPNMIMGFQQDNEKHMTITEYTAYFNEWNAQENGVCITGGYIPLFKAASLLITDSGSFIAEWLPSKNPCIYITNNETGNFSGFNDFGKSILDSYYLADSEEKINQLFIEIMENHNDTKKSMREAVLAKEFKYIGEAGKNIVRYLEEILGE